MDSAEQPREITVVLSEDALAALLEIAESRGLSLENALREAIGNERILMREALAGAKILIKRDREPPRELVVA